MRVRCKDYAFMIETLRDSIREYYHASEVGIAELVCLFISKLPEN